MNEEEKNNIVSRWLKNELTEQEFNTLLGKEEARAYQAILQEVDSFKKPAFNQEKSYQTLLEKRNTPKQKQVFFKSRSYMMIAASVSLLIGLFFLFSSNDTIETTIAGEIKTIELPDGSSIVLNSSSKVTYNKEAWEETRKIILEGQAYFKVAKGKTFDVLFNKGKVSVLGTQFDVRARENTAQVTCYTGKVEVAFATVNTPYILTKGKGVTLQNGNQVVTFNDTNTQATWLNGAYTYNRTSLSIVLEDLSAEYKITFTGNYSADQKFTGELPKENEKLALDLLCSALSLECSKSDTSISLNTK